MAANPIRPAGCVCKAADWARAGTGELDFAPVCNQFTAKFINRRLCKCGHSIDCHDADAIREPRDIAQLRAERRYGYAT